MYVTDNVFQINYFADFADISVNPETTMKFMTLLHGFDLFPSVAQEMVPPSTMPTNRLRLASLNNEWSVFIGSHAINISKNPTDSKATNMGDISEFAAKVVNILTAITSEYPRRSKRISLVTSTLFRELSARALDNAYINIARPTDYYLRNLPFEWNVRSASRSRYQFAGLEEEINVITNVGRAQGKMIEGNILTDIDVINVDTDINTIPQNAESRFSVEQVSEFLSKAVETRSELISQARGYIDDSRQSL